MDGLLGQDAHSKVVTDATSLFRDTTSTKPDLHLKAGSPAVDGGSPVAGAPAADFDNAPRVDGRIDIGAYEYSPRQQSMQPAADPVPARSPPGRIIRILFQTSPSSRSLPSRRGNRGCSSMSGISHHLRSDGTQSARSIPGAAGRDGDDPPVAITLPRRVFLPAFHRSGAQTCKMICVK